MIYVGFLSNTMMGESITAKTRLVKLTFNSRLIVQHWSTSGRKFETSCAVPCRVTTRHSLRMRYVVHTLNFVIFHPTAISNSPGTHPHVITCVNSTLGCTDRVWVSVHQSVLHIVVRRFVFTGYMWFRRRVGYVQPAVCSLVKSNCSSCSRQSARA